MIFSAKDKLEAVEREIKLRKYVYPNRIAARKMTQSLADRQIAVMEAIAEDYRPQVAKERLI